MFVVLTIAIRDDLLARVYEGSDSFETYYLHHDPRGETNLTDLGEHYLVLRQLANGTVTFERGVHRDELFEGTLVVNDAACNERDAHGGEGTVFLT